MSLGSATLSLQKSTRAPGVTWPALWRWCVIALVAAHCAISLALKHSYALTVFGDVTQSLLLAVLTAALAVNALRKHGISRVFWTLMSAGAGLWLTATLLWSFYEIVLRRDVPNPFIGDIVLFVHLIPMTAALVLQPHSVRARRYAVLGLLDLALLVFWWLYVYLLIVMPWWWVQPDLGTYGFNVDLCYDLMNLVFMVAVGVVMLRGQGQWRRFYMHLFGAGALYAGASQVINSAIDVGRYHTGSVYDLPLVAAMAWFGFAAMAGRNLEPEPAPEGDSGIRPVLWPARLAAAAVLSVPLIGWVFTLHTGASGPVMSFRLVVTLAAVLAVLAIFFCKQHFFGTALVKLVDEAQESLENLKKAQRQLVESEKLAALGQLMAGAAHEINNPLTAIMGYADLMATGQGDSAAFAQKIGQQARRTKALMDDLLSFGRESASTKSLADLNAIATNAIRLAHVELMRTAVQVHVDLAEQLPPLWADQNQIFQVIVQLVKNAVDSMREIGGGELRLMTRAEGGYAVLELRDSGRGVESPEKVFDPFYTTKPVGKGRGLGLSAAYGIIRKHEGEISCHSNAPAPGATFRLRLPFAPKSARAMAVADSRG